MKETSPLVVNLSTEIPSPVAHEAVALFVFTGQPALCGVTGELLATVENLMREGDFKGEAETCLVTYATTDLAPAPRRLVLCGLGPPDDHHALALKRAAAIAVRQAREVGLKHLHLMRPVGDDEDHVVAALTEGAIYGAYESNFYQQPDDWPAARLERLTIIVPQKKDDLNAVVARATLIAESVNWARRLADEPGASLPPRELARRAAVMAEEFGLQVETLEAGEVRARGMGGLLGVAQGSVEECALIVIRYEPDGPEGPDEPDQSLDEAHELWAFVGKGITFDTGGLSLKKADGMEEMKADMAGGAAVLGALRAIARLKPARRVVGIIPAAENMPSGHAIKPGDIVKTLAGYTIEVVDTDAEGRLVLVDGIAYARSLGATRIVDLATLTGSIIAALGTHRTGLFSNDDAWANRVQAAAQRAHEPVWRMPVSDDYKKRIESPIADFKNYGGRPDATAAALLLSRFAATTPWVHLDIAGTAWLDEPQPYAPNGATGAGVRTLIELACPPPAEKQP